MPVIDVGFEDISSWSVTYSDRDDYARVDARWFNPASAAEGVESAGSGDPALTLRRAYATPAEASAAARGKLAALRRGTRQLAVSLAPGRPEAAAEATVRLTGFRPGADGSWTCRRVTHRLSGGGYTTAIQADMTG